MSSSTLMPSAACEHAETVPVRYERISGDGGHFTCGHWCSSCGAVARDEDGTYSRDTGFVKAWRQPRAVAAPSSGDDRVAEAIRFLSYAEERLHSAGEEPTENRTYGDILCALAQLRLVPSLVQGADAEKK